MNRSAHCSSAAPRSSVPSLRHDARTTSPRSAPTTAGRPRSSASRAATRPTIPTAPRAAHDGRAVGRVDVRDGRPRLGDGGLHQVAPGQVGGLERIGVDGGLGRILGQQEAGRLERLPHPSGGVQPRRDGEGHGLEVDRGRARSGHAPAGRRCPGRGAGPQPLEPEPRDGAVLADDRRDVRDRPDRREVGQVERRSRAAGLVGEEQLGDLERDAAARQPPVRIGRVRRDAG